MFAANSERPGQPRPTGRRLPPFGHWDQAFALGQFPGSFARASDSFCLLAGFSLGRFFVRLATLHLTKNALALHLLFEGPESLFDIVVTNEYLQNVSNLGAGGVTTRRSRCDAAVNSFRPHDHRAIRSSVAYGKTHREVSDNNAKLEYRGCTRFSQGLEQCHVIADKGRTSWTIPRIRRSLSHQRPQYATKLGAGGRETGRAPSCNHRSVTCGQPYSAWRLPRPSASAWHPLLWHSANIWHG